MSFPTLAEHVVEILAQRARMTIDAPHHRAADTLFDAVIGRLRRTGTAGTFDLFAAEPNVPARRRPLVGVLNHQFRDDPQFRDLIAGMVKATNIAPPAGSEPAGAPSGFNGKRIAIIAVSVLAAAGLIIGGRAAYLALTEEPEPDGNTSCRDFFAMHPDKQRALLEHVYRQRNEPLREHDPYIVASILYGCGQNPERTVLQVVNSSA